METYELAEAAERSGVNPAELARFVELGIIRVAETEPDMWLTEWVAPADDVLTPPAGPARERRGQAAGDDRFARYSCAGSVVRWSP